MNEIVNRLMGFAKNVIKEEGASWDSFKEECINRLYDLAQKEIEKNKELSFFDIRLKFKKKDELEFNFSGVIIFKKGESYLKKEIAGTDKLYLEFNAASNESISKLKKHLDTNNELLLKDDPKMNFDGFIHKYSSLFDNYFKKIKENLSPSSKIDNEGKFVISKNNGIYFVNVNFTLIENQKEQFKETQKIAIYKYRLTDDAISEIDNIIQNENGNIKFLI